jgi:hypothetical protein
MSPRFSLYCLEHGKKGRYGTEAKAVPGHHTMAQVAAHQATCHKGHEVKAVRS